MNFALATLFVNLPSLACVIMAGLLALHGKSAWVWGCFLAAAFVLGGSVSTTTKKE